MRRVQALACGWLLARQRLRLLQEHGRNRQGAVNPSTHQSRPGSCLLPPTPALPGCPPRWQPPAWCPAQFGGRYTLCGSSRGTQQLAQQPQAPGGTSLRPQRAVATLTPAPAPAWRWCQTQGCGRPRCWGQSRPAGGWRPGRCRGGPWKQRDTAGAGRWQAKRPPLAGAAPWLQLWRRHGSPGIRHQAGSTSLCLRCPGGAGCTAAAACRGIRWGEPLTPLPQMAALPRRHASPAPTPAAQGIDVGGGRIVKHAQRSKVASQERRPHHLLHLRPGHVCVQGPGQPTGGGDGGGAGERGSCW